MHALTMKKRSHDFEGEWEGSQGSVVVRRHLWPPMTDIQVVPRLHLFLKHWPLITKLPPLRCEPPCPVHQTWMLCPFSQTIILGESTHAENWNNQLKSDYSCFNFTS